MEELYQTFRTNCQCLMDGRGDVSSANEWFLSFVHEEPVMCWDFCAEVIAGAHLRYDEEQEEQEGRNEWESILVSNHLHESFFAVKLLLNVMQLPHQWREVSEEQGMHARQLLAELLFQPPHMMYTVPLLCNQLCHTLAALIAVSSMDIALQFLEDIQGNSLSDSSVMDMSSVDQACSESIATYLQSMIDVVEKSDDMSVVTSVIHVARDIPALATSLQRSREIDIEFPECVRDFATDCFERSVSALCEFRKVQFTAILRIYTLMSECMSATIESVLHSQCYELLYEALDALVVWSEVSDVSFSTVDSWLNSRILYQQLDYSNDIDGLPSILQLLHLFGQSMQSVLLRLSKGETADLSNDQIYQLSKLLRNCIHRILELFNFVLFFPLDGKVIAVEDGSSSLSQDGLECCNFVFHSVVEVADWILASERERSGDVCEKLTLDMMKHMLHDAFATNGIVSTIEVTKLIQDSICSSSLAFASEYVTSNCDEMNFIFITFSEIVSQFLERHIDSIASSGAKSDEARRFATNGTPPSAVALSSLIYLCLLLPHDYAHITILEALASMMVENHVFNGNEQLEGGLTVIRSLFSVKDAEPCLVSFFSLLLSVGSIQQHVAADSDELEKVCELRVAHTEVQRCLWKLELFGSSPQSTQSSMLLPCIYNQHFKTSFGNFALEMQQWRESLQKPIVTENIRLQQCKSIEEIRSLFAFLVVWSEETVEYFSLDEDEEDENDEGNTDKIYGEKYATYCHDWLALLAAISHDIVPIRECVNFNDGSIISSFAAEYVDIVIMLSKLWESCPHILKAVDPYIVKPFTVCDNIHATKLKHCHLGSPENRKLYAQVLSSTFNIFVDALQLCGLENNIDSHSIPDDSKLLTLISAFKLMAKTCKHMSACKASNLLECFQNFVNIEDDISTQRLLQNINSDKSSLKLSPLVATSTGSKYYNMMAEYVKLIGSSDSDTPQSKDFYLENIIQYLTKPLDEIFHDVSLLDSQDNQYLYLCRRDKISMLLSLTSRLKGLIQSFNGDPSLLVYLPKLNVLLFTALSTVSTFCRYTSSFKIWRREDVTHVMASEDFDKENANEFEVISVLHNAFVSVLCCCWDGPTGLSLTEMFRQMHSLLQEVQSCKLIQLTTILVRWISVDSTDYDMDLFEEAKRLTILIIRRCRLDLDNFGENNECGLVQGGLDPFTDCEWLDKEMPMVWRMCRQICKSFSPPLVSSAALCEMLNLCRRILQCALSDKFSDIHRPFLHTRPLIAVFENLCALILQFQEIESSTHFDKDEVIPVVQDILSLALTFLLYRSPGFNNQHTSDKTIRQIFCLTFFLFRNIHGIQSMSGLELTQELVETIFWPICSNAFRGSLCQDMTQHLVSNGMTAVDVGNEVFIVRHVEASSEEELQIVNFYQATELIAKTILKHCNVRARNLIHINRLMCNALSEVEAIFRILT